MSSPRSPIRIALITAAALAAGLLTTGLVQRAMERRELIREMERLATEVALLRIESNACQEDVAWEEADFRDYNEQVTSLRSEVREFETLDPRGVPAEQYQTYLDTFERYNESVPGWRERADSLRARWEACRDLTVRHNELADSLRRRVEGLSG